jgi:hypothetical protein
VSRRAADRLLELLPEEIATARFASVHRLEERMRQPRCESGESAEQLERAAYRLPRAGERQDFARLIVDPECLRCTVKSNLLAGPTGGGAVIVGQAAIVTSAFLVSVVVQMLGNSRVRHL